MSKSPQEKQIEKEIEQILKQKDKLVARRLRMEIENRIIERKMNQLSNDLNALINKLIEAPPSLTMEEIRLAQVNRGKAIMALRQRLPQIPMDAAREMIDEALNAKDEEEPELMS